MPEASTSNQYRPSYPPGTIIRFFLIGILLLALYYMSDVVLVVVAAIVFASAIEPVMRRLKRHHIHRVISGILIYVAIAALLAGLLRLLRARGGRRRHHLPRQLPRTISIENLWSPIQAIGTSISSTIMAPNTISVSDFVDGLQSLLVGTSSGALSRPPASSSAACSRLHPHRRPVVLSGGAGRGRGRLPAHRDAGQAP